MPFQTQGKEPNHFLLLFQTTVVCFKFFIKKKKKSCILHFFHLQSQPNELNEAASCPLLTQTSPYRKSSVLIIPIIIIPELQMYKV